MKLSAAKIKALKPGPKAQKHYDGHGLHLYVTPSGGKLWRLDYRFLGKPKMISLGAFPAVGLAEARAARDEARAPSRERAGPLRGAAEDEGRGHQARRQRSLAGGREGVA